MRTWTTALAATTLGLSLTAAAAPDDAVKVVYHVNEAGEQATNALRNIDPKRVLEEARLVPSGVAEIGRLQAKEGYVYLKP